jgi:hypothetical protein
MKLTILALLAGVFAAIGFALFGRSNETTTQPQQKVERVETPPVAEAPSDDRAPYVPGPIALSDRPSLDSGETPIELSAETPAETSAVESASGQTAPPLAVDSYATARKPIPAVNESSSPAVRAATATATLPRMASPQVAPFAVLQDPQRPSTPALQNLSQEILAWGESGELRHLPKLLQYAKHPDPKIRAYIALAFDQIATAHPGSPDLIPVLPIVRQMSGDSDPKVKRLATKALSAF